MLDIGALGTNHGSARTTWTLAMSEHVRMMIVHLRVGCRGLHSSHEQSRGWCDWILLSISSLVVLYIQTT